MVHLKDGRPVFVGPVLPEDAWRLQEGLTRMSAESRYLRFFEGFSRFSAAQVKYFTQVDQVHHVAWGAMQAQGAPWPGVAIGRFARLGPEARKAEWAIAIVDEYQRGGLGTLLLAILYLEAEARGLQALTGLVLPENRFVLRWLMNMGATVDPLPEAYEIELPVNRAVLMQTGPGTRLLAVMQEMAERVQSARQAVVQMKTPGQ